MKKSKKIVQHITDKIKTLDKSKKKEYRQPRILNYGKLKDKTIAASPGAGDSAGPSMFRNPFPR